MAPDFAKGDCRVFQRALRVQVKEKEAGRKALRGNREHLMLEQTPASYHDEDHMQGMARQIKVQITTEQDKHLGSSGRWTLLREKREKAE